MRSMTCRQLTFLLLIHFFFTLSQAQENVDTLKLQLANTTKPLEKYDLFNTLASRYMRYNIDSAAFYVDKMKLISDAHSDPILKAKTSVKQGFVSRLRANYPEGIAHFNLAVQLLEQDTSQLYELHLAVFNLGVLHQFLGDYEQSFQFLYRDIGICNQLEKKNLVCNALNSIGINHKNQKEFAKALDIYDQAIDICRTEGYDIQLSNLLINRANVLENLARHEEAIESAKESLEIDRADGYEMGIAHSFFSLSSNYLKLNQLDSAQINVDSAYIIWKKLGRTKNIGHAERNMGLIQLKLGHLSSAEGYLLASLAKSKELGLLLDSKTNLSILAEIYEKRQAWDKVSAAMKEEAIWTDSLYKQEKIRSIKELELKYDVKSKEQNLKIAQLELARQSQQRNRLYQGIIALGILSLISIYIISQRAHFRKIKMQHDLQLQEAKIEELNKINYISTLNATLAGEESERKRIATDLHDSLGALLATVKLHFRNINKHLTAVQELAPFKKASNLLDEAAVEVRRIAHNMMPAALIEFGLIASIEEMVIQLKEQGYQVQFDKFGEDERMDPEREMMVYRIFQELIQNIIKHSGARKIIIQYTQDGDKLHLIVEDDGKGFNPAKIKSGIGTKSIQSRVKFLDGKLNVDSKEGIGTNIHLSMNVEKPEADSVDGHTNLIKDSQA